MSRIKSFVLAAVITAVGLTAIAADNFIYKQPVPITGKVSLSATNITTKPFYLTSVLLNMPQGGSNTFTVSYIRATITNTMLNVSATNMTDLIWFVPSRVYLRLGDTLVFSNTSLNAGTLTLNAEF